jgi:hypothetical protein
MRNVSNGSRGWHERDTRSAVRRRRVGLRVRKEAALEIQTKRQGPDMVQNQSVLQTAVVANARKNRSQTNAVGVIQT